MQLQAFVLVALLPGLAAQGVDTNQQWVGPNDETKGTILYRPLVAVQIWKCFDLPNGDTTNGNHIQIWDCEFSLASNFPVSLCVFRQ
jgi:hypothetical protein